MGRKNHRMLPFRTISDFRKLHLEAFTDVFVQVLRVAGEAGMVKLGNIATDGTKIQGHASRHKAMSYGYMRKEADRVREDIETLVTQAHEQDAEDDAALGSRRGDELPAELARREDRLATIEAAMRRLEARAKAQAEEERQQRAAAEAERQRTGQKRRGKAPKEQPFQGVDVFGNLGLPKGDRDSLQEGQRCRFRWGKCSSRLLNKDRSV